MAVQASATPECIRGVQMLTVKCAKCRAKLFRYLKIGKGRLLHCWHERIIKDYTVREHDAVKCRCGQLIGIDEGKWIKLKRGAFTCSGTAVRK